MNHPPHYYNEFDPNAAAWLRQLIEDKQIPYGHVDSRSITEVQPSDLDGFVQCHFFAGISGWSLALKLAGWPPDRPAWTGSCPCQPYSSSGKGKGDADERNLWPAFFNLIRQCRPECVFGEQVENAIGHGWLDGISGDLEGEGYACGAVVLGAHSVGAPHIRQRLYWGAQRMADAGRTGYEGKATLSQSRGVSNAQGGGSFSRMAHSIGTGLQGHPGHERDRDQPGRQHADAAGSTAAGGATGFWSDSRWIYCRDGKHRRIPTQSLFQFESDGVYRGMGNGWGDCATDIEGFTEAIKGFPLASGEPFKLPGRGSIRPALLKGAGNAIVPQVAAEFITAFLEATA